MSSTDCLVPQGHYVFLLRPAMNRVYAKASVELSIGEIAVLNEGPLSRRLGDIAETRLGAVPYVRFSCEALGERDIRYLSNLSSMYALFEVVDGPLLRPIALAPLDRFDDDLMTIQKYQGKTNEHFTKLLVNVTVAATAFAAEMLERPLHILDPLCGRGTTLNQALMYGWNATGIDVDEGDIRAYEQFIGTYLKRKRLKHHLEKATIRDQKRAVGRRFEAEIGSTKEAYKAGDTLRLRVLNVDTTRARDYCKAQSFHAIVADLPYGVRHGSRSSRQDLSRRPLELLEAALPVWTAVLKHGGAIGIAWNRHVAGRGKVVDLLAANGLEVMESEPYLSFRHVVDQSILRDVIVARRPKRNGGV